MSIGALFSLVIILLVVGLLLWLAFYVLSQFAPPDPVGRIIKVVVVVIAVLVIITLLLQFAGVDTGPVFRR